MNGPPSAETLQPRAPALPKTVKLLGWASFLNDVASEMIFPQLPQFLLQVLGGSKFFLGSMEGAAEATASLLKLWSGARTDQTGKRKGMVIAGYGLASVSRPLIGLVTAYWQVFFLRIADRIGKGIRTSPRDALIADVTDESTRGRAFGFHRGMDHLGAAVGPIVAALFLYFWPEQLRILFLLAIVPGIAVVILTFWLREHRSPFQRDASATRPTLHLTLRPFDADFRWFLVALLMFTLGNSTDMFLLVRAGEMGVATRHLPLLWCLFHIAKSLGNMLAGHWVDRFGPKPLLIVGWLWYALVYLLFAFVTASWQLWVVFVGYAGYYALTEPAEKTLVANLVSREHKGLAFGWYNLIIGAGALPASLMFGALYDFAGARVAFGMGSLLALAAMTMLAFVHARRASQQSEDSNKS